MKTKYYLFVMVGLLLLSCEEFENMDCSHIVSHNVSHDTLSVDLWKKGRIPYEFASDYPHDKEFFVLFAMAKWESQTKAIDFVPRNNEPEYLLINWSEGTQCNSTLGAGNPCKVNFSDYGVLCHVEEIDNLLNKLKSYDNDTINTMLSKGREVYQEYYSFEGCAKNIMEVLDENYLHNNLRP